MNARPRYTAKAPIAMHALLFAACAMLCILIALLEGKDFNFDFRNYHLYGPWALLNARYDVDFMAAGPGSYLNPVAHLPLYLLVTQGVDDRLATAVLAALHAFCPYFILLIARRMFAHEAPAARRLLVATATLLSMLSSLFWGLVGSTFTDLIVASFLLASLYACLRAGDRDTRGLWVLSGVLFGIGVALKLTLLLFVPAMAAAVLAGANWRRPVGIAWFAVGGTSGAVVAGGVSALAVYRAYGSPVFPLFNGIFRSDLALIGGSTAHGRFIPDSLWQAVLRPFRMLDSHSMIYVENSAPDARFAVILLLLAVMAAGIVVRSASDRTAWLSMIRGGQRDQLQLWGFLVVGWLCWLMASGNGRYGAVLFMLAGPAVVVLSRSLLPTKFAAGALLLLVVTQSYFLLISFDHRWTKTDWLGQWIAVDVPAAERRAHGYILTELNTNSVAFPSLHPASAYFAVAGQVPQARLPAVERRLERFKDHWSGRLRYLMPTARAVPDRIPRHKVSLLALQGLRPVDTSTASCNRIVVYSDRSGKAETQQVLLSCPLELAPPDYALQAHRLAMQVVFDRVAASCRLWFPAWGDHPPLPRVGGWERRYEATDVTLFTYKDQIMLSRGDFGPFDVKLGSVAAWSAHREREMDCRPLPRHFASDEVRFRK